MATDAPRAIRRPGNEVSHVRDLLCLTLRVSRGEPGRRRTPLRASATVARRPCFGSGQRASPPVWLPPCGRCGLAFTSVWRWFRPSCFNSVAWIYVLRGERGYSSHSSLCHPRWWCLHVVPGKTSAFASASRYVCGGALRNTPMTARRRLRLPRRRSGLPLRERSRGRVISVLSTSLS